MFDKIYANFISLKSRNNKKCDLNSDVWMSPTRHFVSESQLVSVLLSEHTNGSDQAWHFSAESSFDSELLQ